LKTKYVNENESRNEKRRERREGKELTKKRVTGRRTKGEGRIVREVVRGCMYVCRKRGVRGLLVRSETP